MTESVTFDIIVGDAAASESSLKVAIISLALIPWVLSRIGGLLSLARRDQPVVTI